MNKDYIINKIEEELGNVKVAFKEVEKTYGTRHGIMITPEGASISPTIYYDENDDDDTIVRFVLHAYEEQAKVQLDFDTKSLAKDLTDWNWAKERIIPRIYNKERCAIKDLVTFDIAGDIAAMFSVVISLDGTGMSSTRVTRELAKNWNVTDEEILEAAKQNLNNQLVIRDMNDIIMEMMTGEGAPTERSINRDSEFAVASNIGKCNGAGALLLFKDLIENGELEDRDYYILPSSIHEVIFLKRYDEGFKSMVKEVNETTVSAEDFLSDNVFKYNHETKEIEVAA